MSLLTDFNQSHLCSQCRSIFSRANAIEEEIRKDGRIPLPVGKPTYAHHQNLANFKESVAKKCYICVRLWAGMYPKVDISDLMSFNPARPFDIRYSLTTEKLNPWFMQVRVWFMEGKLNNVMPSLRGSFVAMPTILIKPHLATFSFPTGDTEVEIPPRFEQAHTEYLTLSHCWGGIQIFSLVKANIERLKVSIPITSLSRVFQDAILTTIELGFNYLWIDSLCIIQDSDGGEDWVRESPTMDRIYCNSVCNLSATGFRDGEHGLFVDTDVRETFPPSIDCSKFVSEKIEYSIMSTFDWTREVSGGPLSARGWVFQEHIMFEAPRVLHFGSRQVFWECYSANCCQAFPREFPNGLSNAHYLKQRVAMPVPKYKTLTSEQLYTQWRNVIVREYTGKNLTRGTDRLPALSGIAKVFGRHLGVNYFGGLWGGDAHRSLLWSGTGDFKVSESETYRAPTWSWASVDGPITWPDFGNSDVVWHAAAQVKEIATTPLDTDPTGQLSAGHLRLEGDLIKIIIKTFPEEAGGTLSLGRLKTPMGTRSRVSILKGRLETPLGNLSFDALELVFYEGEDRPGDLEISPSVDGWKKVDEILFMPLLYCRGDGKSDSRIVLGLALSPVAGCVGSYKKIGVIQTSKYSVMKALMDRCRPKESQYYEEYDGGINYTIKVV
ncbi:heterokaryon incompatibility protein-domain-containing protein [Leptodontidium sp. MPI-SDFR-AT-0119]|nr:heterokaryon incompatibility protein-domain-containing protein [Leptodontidium sp. MPI-SDFR-AT-0119]